MKFNVLLSAKESILLLNYIKENKIKTKGEAIRKCLKTVISIEAKYDMLKDIDSKLNRIIYRENIQKKITRTILCKYGFQEKLLCKRR